MQAQDAPTLFLMKLWPWLETNLKAIIAGAIIIAVVIFGTVFYKTHQGQKEIDAGQALSHLSFENHGVDALLKVAGDYPGTAAGKRAMLEAAETLFAAGKYPDAQAQFQKYLDNNPDSQFSDEASLGVAESLEAQGKTDAAASAYQRVSSQSGNPSVIVAAKFGLARIDQLQGKTADAEKVYQDVARANPGSPYAQEAAMRAMELKTTQFVPSVVSAATNAPAKTAPASTPFQLIQPK
ncbi:MAG TPA: tetratricopeptide repeat protein [Verrucomicrobiae bacterium]|nr:tetratricopeptide repeat protein [Verrucomicrobiae bacterium]